MSHCTLLKLKIFLKINVLLQDMLAGFSEHINHLGKVGGRDVFLSYATAQQGSMRLKKKACVLIKLLVQHLFLISLSGFPCLIFPDLPCLRSTSHLCSTRLTDVDWVPLPSSFSLG
jgi:hypothetical protein